MVDTQAEVPLSKSRQWQGLTLAQYVQHRNGVPLGAPDSLKNMLVRSLGARSFAEFWRYWNPIWGYALGRYVYAPFRSILLTALAVLLTFAVSGGIHDLVATLVRRSGVFLFTPWFLLMGAGVVVGHGLRIDYAERAWATRVVINLAYVLGCLAITLLARQIVPGLPD
ncbi:MAG: acyltransferase [Anaerolineae bacterium]|nr:acyltransferase [Anaerolineae bacterium]